MIKADNINALCHQMFDKILREGYVTDSRNGSCYELEDVDFYLTSPRNRHLCLNGRKNNIFATMAETIWVLAGKDKIDPVMTFFLPRSRDYSDDGETWRGAYGPRIFNGNQIRNVIEQFSSDGKHTRRACMTIWRPDMDTVDNIFYESTKDIPCSTALWFWIRDNKFNCKLQMRSNDALWGASAINIFEFTVLQEIIFSIVREMYPEIELGYYHHSAISSHLYEKTCKQARDVLSSNNDNNIKHRDSLPLDVGKFSYEDLCQLFKNLYWEIQDSVMSRLEIDPNSKKYYLDDLVDRLDKSLGENNILSWYTILPCAYALSTPNNDLISYILERKDPPSEDLKYAVVNSPFRHKFVEVICPKDK